MGIQGLFRLDKDSFPTWLVCIEFPLSDTE
ncbi:hypothetical protein SAMN05216277_12115 [Halolamina pelagica]|uniref:Uncharacterized protein n=1 Tax=Halolamina pelagica TaxID=699431 RepID=A0A1I5VX04_9EURY|nr:hypothetical protein SAMN05216277_12115 [Halolamina pelagica]